MGWPTVPNRRPTPFARLRPSVLAIFQAGASTALSGLLGISGLGCEGTTGSHGTHRDVSATYFFGDLTCDLPDKLRVPAIASAADAVLRDRGYAVSESRTGADFAEVKGKLQGDGWYEGVILKATVSSSGTRVRIHIDPVGDEAASRAILDAVLVRLGH